MVLSQRFVFIVGLVGALALSAAGDPAGTSERLAYNRPGTVVDLGVGLWAQPLPVDFDGDGDYDLLVATADTPSNGIYFFENAAGNVADPVFRPGKRLDRGMHNLTISYVDGTWHILSPGKQYPDFQNTYFAKSESIPCDPIPIKSRADQWKLVDYDGDGVTDLIISKGDWSEYGWDNAYNASGVWLRGPLHGYVFFVKNTGTDAAPAYAEPEQLVVGDKPLDVYGCPSPNFADWDGDGDLDLVCGEFLDRITYFENVGTRTEPVWAAGRFLKHGGQEIRMDLEMLQVQAFDWDRDGDMDLIVGQEDGRVAFVENTGMIVDRVPGVPAAALLPPGSRLCESGGALHALRRGLGRRRR